MFILGPTQSLISPSILQNTKMINLWNILSPISQSSRKTLPGSCTPGEILVMQSYHTVEYDPFIKRQLASRNQLEGQMWCNFGHVTH